MKEVIFHFSASVRFLGLSLKILFHKNKEIKRNVVEENDIFVDESYNITCICFHGTFLRWRRMASVHTFNVEECQHF